MNKRCLQGRFQKEREREASLVQGAGLRSLVKKLFLLLKALLSGTCQSYSIHIKDYGVIKKIPPS